MSRPKGLTSPQRNVLGALIEALGQLPARPVTTHHVHIRTDPLLHATRTCELLEQLIASGHVTMRFSDDGLARVWSLTEKGRRV